jgi:hypothetical protein
LFKLGRVIWFAVLRPLSLINRGCYMRDQVWERQNRPPATHPLTDNVCPFKDILEL